ncbi:MAG: KamA family radical SAM protein [Magnetococcales bacterium]|nr:KamA family radical SAM protein [Magnetococcales bacterium]MBF0437481.1 KamA family radical SAM protein [Magnetococcales bacterium]
MNEWRDQLKHHVNTLEKLEQFIKVTPGEREAILAHKNTRWGTTPYFAALMDKEDPSCPIRMQVIPSLLEHQNQFGMEGYLVWKENRSTQEIRPDSIARQYRDRVAFAVTQTCGIYCRHCFRREMTIDKVLKLRLDVDEGLLWITQHPEIRDVLITGGDPLLLSDDEIEYLIRKLREIPHIEMIRFGTRLPIVLPHRITESLTKRLAGYHKVPIWINTQCNHPKEITEHTARVVYDLATCGINVGNQAVLLKGINDTVEVFRELHQQLLKIRIRPYYVFYCESAPGIDHFRTPLEKGAELIRDALRGHTTGLAQPLYVVATNIGKIPIVLNDGIVSKDEQKYILKNHDGRFTELPVIPE